MKIELSEYSKRPHLRLKKPFGVFYFFEKFVVAEINEGEHFSYEYAKEIIDFSYIHYGSSAKIAYISNRINSYSVELALYSKMKKDGHQFIVATAIIIYSEIGLKMATLEKFFARHSVKRCLNLRQAIGWVLTLEEFNL